MVLGRGLSSRSITEPSPSVTGVISRAQKPSSRDTPARCWDRAAKRSISSRGDALGQRDVLRRLPHRDVGVGEQAVRSAGRATRRRPPPRTRAVRSCASSNSGFLVPGIPSELPFSKRDTVSTPAARNTSPSPARIACAAIRAVCSDDEQYRVTVTPGTVSRPSWTRDDAREVCGPAPRRAGRSRASGPRCRSGRGRARRRGRPGSPGR